MEHRAPRWAGAAMAAAIGGAIVTPASAEPTPRIVLHVGFADSRAVAMETLELAKPHASDIYDAIGVTLVWTMDTIAPRTDPGVMHLGVFVLSHARTSRFMKDSPGLPETVLGAAPPESGRVYVFWGRIIRHAEKEGVQPSVVLGRVLAHEIGHHLLPDDGHSRDGLMRASLNYQVVRPPAFTNQQAESIRARLGAAN
jgi:hypothetical protein